MERSSRESKVSNIIASNVPWGDAVRDERERRAEIVDAAPDSASEETALEALTNRTRAELLAAAKKLGLTGVSKLRKEPLADRVLEAMRPRMRAVAPASPAPPSQSAGPAAAPASEREPAGTAKLDLGPAARVEEKPIEHIPWSYGQDRVTAAAVDPWRLFAYWEVTDLAIARASGQLGPGGPGAWLNLRVYDTTGLIFDGTNAHGYFDHRVERHDRQWFFDVGKPSSTAYVEVGLKSSEGFFVKIARSGRVDFPRAEHAPWSEPEWMTVRVATGEAHHAGRGAPSGPPARAGEAPRGAIPLWDLAALGPVGQESRIWQFLHGEGERVEWREIVGEGWFELEGRVEWEGPLTISTWEAGPFSYPVAIEPPTRQEWQGRSFAYRVGDVTHVVYGPWQVVIRNLGAHLERGEIARWEVFRSWVAGGGREARIAVRPGAAVRAGASEALGASERRWIAASELRLGGGSEVWRLGASEVRLRGASELLFAGASQWVRRGASERRLGGASEVRLAGASERRLVGGSERRLGGASELRLGASEHRLGGGESRLDGVPPAGGGSGKYPNVER